jgi:hypothetical protein
MLLPYTPDIDYVELKNSDGKRVGAFHNYPVNMSYFVSMTTDTDEYEGVKCYKIIIYTSDERWTDWKFASLKDAERNRDALVKWMKDRHTT